MTLRIAWLTPFTARSGVGTFSKAVTDAFPETYKDKTVELTIISPISDPLYSTRHRFIDIESTKSNSMFYDMFDMIICNIGNNNEHHRIIFEVLRNFPAILIVHDYVYQHFLAALIFERDNLFTDYIALLAEYGSAATLKVACDSNVTGANGLRYGPWDTDFVASESLGAPILQLGTALIVHSAFSESYAQSCFTGPVLRLGLPWDMRPNQNRASPKSLQITSRHRRVLVSFGHVQPTKCIPAILDAIASSPKLQEQALYVISGFGSETGHVAQLRDFVEENGLEDCVCFHLNLSDGDLEALSDQADGFINLRYPNTEGSSASLIEQLCTGKPVLVFDSGCYAELPDDAAIKVARNDDPAVLRNALERMLEDKEILTAIGARGRAYARKIDCALYASRILDFVIDERQLLGRRASERGRDIVGFDRTTAADNAREIVDEAWLTQLTRARTVFNLIDRNVLANDPEVMRNLGDQQTADFTQAVILRESRKPVLNFALLRYFQHRSDGWMAARLLDVLRRAVHGDVEAAGVIADMCPHEDLHFWNVVAAIGCDTLATASHLAFFGSLPEARSSYPQTTNSTQHRRQLADELAARSKNELLVKSANLDALLPWLRMDFREEQETLLESVAIGQQVVVGSKDYSRFVRLSGFHKIEADHAWSGEEEGLVYLQLAYGAREIRLSGHAIQNDTSVSVTARTSSLPVLGSGQLQIGANEISISFPDLPVSGMEMLCIAIQNVGCRSPQELGLADDGRQLGFCLEQIAVL